MTIPLKSNEFWGRRSGYIDRSGMKVLMAIGGGTTPVRSSQKRKLPVLKSGNNSTAINVPRKWFKTNYKDK